jgi:hypothetical protein
VYQIEQWARGDKLWRRVTVSREEQANGAQQDLSEADKAEIARIAKLYGSEAPKIKGQRASFVGAFSGALPHDVGGDGHYVHWESPLGSVSVYVERFRGNDDLAAVLEARRKSVDRIVDLVIGWFDSELHDASDWPALRKFLDVTFRRDLQNLSLYGWLAGVRPESESKNSEIAFRVIQYLVERHYASYEDAPTLLREFSGLNERNESQSFLARIRRLLLARAQAPADGQLAQRLGFLKDATSAWASWRHYFQTTPFYQRELAEFRRRKEEEERQRAKAAEPTANAGVPKREHLVVAIDLQEFERDLYLESFNAFLDLNTGDSIRVQSSLETPREPFWTNGKYNAKERRVEWSQRIPEVGQSSNKLSREWPGFCCAAWDDPNEQAQKQLLGAAGITRDRLLNYNLWYEGLSSREKQDWDTFLPTVRGDAKYADRLKAFAFFDEPGGRKGSERLASDGANAVLQVLGPPKQEREEGQILINGVPLFPKSPEPRKKEVDSRD